MDDLNPANALLSTPAFEVYTNGSKKPRQRFLNWKYAICMGESRGLDGILGAFEYARIHKERLKFLCSRPLETYIKKLSNNLKKNISFGNDVLKDVQEYYDREYGNIRLFLYGTDLWRKNKRLYYINHDAKYEHNLFVYKHSNGKYFVITNVGKFFDTKSQIKYCIECNTRYLGGIFNEHNAKCPLRCDSCMRVNPKGKCKEKNALSCIKCYKMFYNDDCFAYHKVKKMCGTSFKCLKCNTNVNYDAFRRRGIRHKRPVHTCGEKKCFNCFTYHFPHNECVILKQKKMYF